MLSAVLKAEILSSFKVGVFNAQFVINKSASECHGIAHIDLHVAAVVETWHDGNDSSSLVACLRLTTITLNELDPVSMTVIR